MKEHMFRPLFLERFRMMVRLGLARSRVQPFLEIHRAASYELRATSKQMFDCSKLAARGSKLEADCYRSFGIFGDKPGL